MYFVGDFWLLHIYPQNPIIKKVLCAEKASAFEMRYVKTAVAIKQPKKFATNVPAGKYMAFGNISDNKYLVSAPNPPPIKTIKPFILLPFPEKL